MADHGTAFEQAFGRLHSEGSRREFLRLAGLMGGGLVVAACSDGDDDCDENVTAPNCVAGAVTLNFAQPVGVLTYAFALEALEADFYTRVAAGSAFNGDELTMMREIRDHEVAHREFLRAAITANGGTIPTLTPQYGTLNINDRAAVLTTARTFEDLGVAAYNGAGRYLTATAALPLLTIAGKIVSVEARHASAIRDLIAPNTDHFANVQDDSPAATVVGANETQGLDGKATPQQVLAAAAPFIAESASITVTGTTA